MTTTTTEVLAVIELCHHHVPCHMALTIMTLGPSPKGAGRGISGGPVLPNSDTSVTQDSQTSGRPNQSTGNQITPTNTTSKYFVVNAQDCPNDYIDGKFMDFYGLEGEVTGVLRGNFNLSILICKWQIRVPKNLYMIATVEIITTEICFYGIRLEVSYGLPFNRYRVVNLNDHDLTTSVLLSLSNVVYFILSAYRFEQFPQFQITFKATKERLWERLITNSTTPLSGSIFPPGYDGTMGYAPIMNATQSVELPRNHSLMISFEQLKIYHEYRCDDSVTVFKKEISKNVRTQLLQICKTQYVFPQMYNFSITLRFCSNSNYNNAGFKMRFTMHPYSESPSLVDSGMFNCSTVNYVTFRQHLHCNMKQECEGREDEGGFCPFSSPVCDGAVAVHDKCYIVYKTVIPTSALKHQLECRRHRSTLVMTKTGEDRKAMALLLDYITKVDKISIGMRGYRQTMPQYYRRTLFWMDDSVPYSTNMWSEYSSDLEQGRPVPSLCVAYVNKRCNQILIQACYKMPISYYICERTVSQPRKDDTDVAGSRLHLTTQQNQYSARENGGDESKMFFPSPLNYTQGHHYGLTGTKLTSSPSDFLISSQSFVACSSGHFTLEMLACFPDAKCGVTKPRSWCHFSSSPDHTPQSTPPSFPSPAVQTFQCEKVSSTIPYTFVCDFHEDCKDQSDEDFCVHDSQCTGFQCQNGQCIDVHLTCDTFRHCKDGSDETACHHVKQFWRYPRKLAVPPPAVIDFDGSGLFSQQPMNDGDRCPSTHVRCAGDHNYCVPVYVRCNGLMDCFHHDDELDCDTSTCPGFYRCWHSPVCLHAAHLCDGWSQCPRHDDELLCDMTCPGTCGCQGQAFVCHQPFPAWRFPQLRYLDATGSGMAPEDLRFNFYIIELSMADCNLGSLPLIDFKNLRILNVNENLLISVNVSVFLSLRNLKTVSLVGNPLVNLYESQQSTVVQQNLHSVDMSRTKLVSFDSFRFANFSSLCKLNMSFSKLKHISKNGFEFVPNLTELDIRGNDIDEYPAEMLKVLTQLQFLYASDFKFCCKARFPKVHKDIVCVAPDNEISSCEDLLRSNMHRSTVWLAGTTCLVGNIGSFLVRLWTQSDVFTSGCQVFVSHLCVSDLLMGVYLTMVGTADAWYRGQYLWYQTTWMTSVHCQGAGFLSLLSSEVSAFIICLITLDRLIVLRFPSSTLKFNRKSAAFASLFVWLIGIAIAVIPLLPATSHWEFYGNTGICVPLPITRTTFLGRDYSFGVIIVVNFVLFLLIAAGQLVIYCSIKSSLMMVDRSRKGQDMTVARRLLTVVVSDFACWFPIGVLSLLSSAGVAVSGEVNVAVAIFVLPLNSALNPFLYTLNLLLETRRRRHEDKLMTILKARIMSTAVNIQSRNMPRSSREHVSSLTISDALHFLGSCLADGRTTLDAIQTSFLALDTPFDLKLTDHHGHRQ